ncbi:hypothetical protein M9H77_32035 [Catharanthus roseus]|uniref:Uncharacterized protein n=1 Tax=Catharanthus roseus TaxID=4058 RepID=A0ACC0A611_CATRO|nr:hypothetical protein M9H77_32035 [Catharanthus roseus]
MDHYEEFVEENIDLDIRKVKFFFSKLGLGSPGRVFVGMVGRNRLKKFPTRRSRKKYTKCPQESPQSDVRAQSYAPSKFLTIRQFFCPETHPDHFFDDAVAFIFTRTIETSGHTRETAIRSQSYSCFKFSKYLQKFFIS